MRFEIVLSTQSVVHLKRLSARDRATAVDAIEIHLRFEPEKTSKSRIKRLRGEGGPQYRLRVGELRIYYDVVSGQVEILAIVEKSGAEAWLAGEGAEE